MIMMLAAAFAAIDVWADEQKVDGYTWTYQINGDTAEIYNDDSIAVSPKPTSSVTIPSMLGGKNKICLRRFALLGCTSLKTVTFPASMTACDANAFDGCSGLESFTVSSDNPSYKAVNGLLLTKSGAGLVHGVNGDVVVPDGVVSIMWAAFISLSGLTSVEFPSTVRRITSCAFWNCSGLKSVELPAALKVIESRTFYGCTSLKDVSIGNGVTNIEDRAFVGCTSLSSMTIPNSVMGIGNCAFKDCVSLTSVLLPKRFEGNLDPSVFEGCSSSLVITYVDYAPTLTIGGGKTSMSRQYSYEPKTGESFSVACNDSWTATASASWIMITSGASGIGDGTIRYKLASNAGTSKREGKITVTSGSLTCTCTITQDKMLLIGGKTSMSRTYDAAKHADCFFSVSCSQSPWTAVSSASWVALHSDSKSGTGTAKLYYDVAANTSTSARTATIKVTSRGLTRTCTITQKAGAAPTLTIGGGKTSMSRQYSCAAKSGESFSVACNVSWTATASASWIKITTGASGSGAGKVTYSLTENTGTSKREGKITVMSGSLTRTCTITQDKPLLIGGKTSMSRTYDAAKHADCYFSVTCSQSPWTAVSSASWLTLHSDSKSGTGTAKLYYDVAANTSTSARTATIKVTSRGLTRTCTIKQKGK